MVNSIGIKLWPLSVYSREALKKSLKLLGNSIPSFKKICAPKKGVLKGWNILKTLTSEKKKSKTPDNKTIQGISAKGSKDQTTMLATFMWFAKFYKCLGGKFLNIYYFRLKVKTNY